MLQTAGANIPIKIPRKFQVPKGMLQTSDPKAYLIKRDGVSSPQGNATNLMQSPHLEYTPGVSSPQGNATNLQKALAVLSQIVVSSPQGNATNS